MSKSKSHWVTEWQGHLLSCSGQLKKRGNFEIFGKFWDFQKITIQFFSTFFLQFCQLHTIQPMLARSWRFLAVICRFSKSQILKRCLCCICLCLCHCLCLFVGQDMSPHHSDQMSGRSEVNWIVFCMTISKVLSQSVSDKVTYWAVLDS